MSDHYSENKKCRDCGILIDNRSTRCYKCFSKNNTGKNHPNYHGATICPKCGGKKKDASKICRQCWNKSIFGENNHAWKDGRSLVDTSGRSSKNSRNTIFEYATWRLQIFKKDDFTCQHCQKKGGKLRAHHVQNFSKYTELQLEVFNGVTLCDKCHKLFHSLFGNKNNSLGQLEWFFKNVKLHKGVNNGS